MAAVIIFGSRTIKDYDWLCAAIQRSGYTITSIISGKEPNGVDALGERWAAEHKLLAIPFPAEWSRYGASAGPRRNTEMSRVADAGICLRLAKSVKSRGTDNMIKQMRRFNKPVYIEYEDEKPEHV